MKNEAINTYAAPGQANPQEGISVPNTVFTEADFNLLVGTTPFSEADFNLLDETTPSAEDGFMLSEMRNPQNSEQKEGLSSSRTKPEQNAATKPKSTLRM